MKTLRPALLLFVVPAVLVWLAPGGAAALVYDRTGVLAGQWWRLWTGHWVHFSPSHLAWNLVVLCAAGGWLERSRAGLLLRFTVIAAPLLSLVLLAFASAMQAYGGLSGLATGVVTLLALAQLADDPDDRGRWLAVLALVGMKIALDAVRDQPVFSAFPSTAIHSSALAHAAGAALALIYFCFADRFLFRRGPAASPLASPRSGPAA